MSLSTVNGEVGSEKTTLNRTDQKSRANQESHSYAAVAATVYF